MSDKTQQFVFTTWKLARDTTAGYSADQDGDDEPGDESQGEGDNDEEDGMVLL